MRYSFAFSFLTISYFSICPAPQAVRRLANHVLLQIDIILVYCAIVLTGRCELTRVTRCACVTAMLYLHSLCLFFSLSRAADSCGHHCYKKTLLHLAFCCDFPLRANHVQAPQMLYLSPSSLAIFVPELLALCQPQEELVVPASLFTDKEPALLLLLLIQRNWEFHSVLKKADFACKITTAEYRHGK